MSRHIYLLFALGLIALGASVQFSPGVSAHSELPQFTEDSVAYASPLQDGSNESSCSCSKLDCKTGSHRSCTATCSPPKAARCECDAMCTSEGKKSGSNSCVCQ